MEVFSKQDEDEAHQFFEFYTNLIENHVENAMFSLSEKAILDWFGKTIRGEKNIDLFLKTNTGFCHQLNNPRPVSKIGHRDSHVLNIPKLQKRRSLSLKEPTSAKVEEKTPPKEAPGSSHMLEQGQGDGLHNCELSESPVKRCRLDEVVVTETVQCSPVKFVKAEGHIEFRRKSSKKYQRETKWSRPCTLEIAYSSTNIQDSTIHLIIYSSHMKCKRNLLKDFELAQSTD